MSKKSFAKNASLQFKRLFHARNIIVVSAHKVDHIPLTGRLQVLVVLALVVGVSGLSYLAGGYVAAKAQMEEKDRKLAIAEAEKSMMDKDFALIKRDLTKVKENGKELSEYSKFVLDQHIAKDPKTGAAVAAGKDDNKLVTRIAYLEKRINEINNDTNHLLVAIRERTEGKINLFQDIIAATGLNEKTLARSAKVAEGPKKPAAPISTAKKTTESGQGGPFIPYEQTTAPLSKESQALLDNIEKLVALNHVVNDLPIGLPIRHYQERSGFGYRADPFNHRGAFHPGLDLAGPYGENIFAANDGTVSFAGRESGYGNMVEIEHGLGLSTRYGHLSKILVNEGAKVKKGQLIALEGSTGRSTGPHLHYEVRYYDKAIDPKKFLNARRIYVSQIQQ